jgi:hypothetical protein
MDLFYFVIRHTPFWAIPFIYIGGQFGYLYWTKDYRKPALAFLCLAFLSLCTLSYYYWAGGPEKSVERIQQTLEKWR